jgi:hypothetical protein
MYRLYRFSIPKVTNLNKILSFNIMDIQARYIYVYEYLTSSSGMLATL